MKTKIAQSISRTLFALFAVGLGSSQAQALTCKGAYLKYYVHGAKHKAFASTGGRSALTKQNTSCGDAEGYATVQAAINAAMQSCHKSDRKYKDEGQCQIILAE